MRSQPSPPPWQVLVYVSICSLIGSLSVVSCKALGIALKLTLGGHNQLYSFKTYVFAVCVLLCVGGQMNYLNKALDTFNTAMVSSVRCRSPHPNLSPNPDPNPDPHPTPDPDPHPEQVYYIFFTICTITASSIMYKASTALYTGRAHAP